MRFARLRFRSCLAYLMAFLVLMASVSFPVPLLAAGPSITAVTLNGASLPSISDLEDDGHDVTLSDLSVTLGVRHTLGVSYPDYLVRGEVSYGVAGFLPFGGNVSGYSTVFNAITLPQANEEYTVTMVLYGVSGGVETKLDEVSFELHVGALDTTPPHVLSSICDPKPNDSSVPVDSDIRVAFSEDIDEGSVNSASVYLTATGSTTKISAVYSVTGGNKAIINPASSLTYSTTYKVSVTSAVKDMAGNGAVATSYTFTTASNPSVAAQITSRTPADKAKDIDVDTNIVIVLDKPLDLAASDFTAGVSLKKGTAVVAASVIPINSDSGCEITINPVSELDAGAIYTVVIGSNKLKDENGRFVAGTSWTFTTEAGAIPTIIDRDPDVNEGGVLFDKLIKITFSKAINATTLTNNTIYLKKQNSSTKVSAELSYSSSTRTVSIKPNTDLSPSTIYYVYVTEALKDTEGNSAIAENWKFTTSPNYTRILEKSPEDGTVNVPVDTKVTFKFSEDMDEDTIDKYSVYLRRSDSTSKIGATVSYNSSTSVVTLTPASNLQYDKVYTVYLTDDIENEDGDPIDDQSWSFTTMDDDYPHIVERNPAAGSSTFPIDGTIEIEFSASMKSSTITTTNIYMKKMGSSTKLSAEVDYDSSDKMATLKPKSALAYNTEYTVYVTTGVQDKYGTAVFASEWTFKTAPEKAKISSLDPADGAKDIPINKTITFKFSKAMTSGTIDESSIYLKKSGSSSKVDASVSYSSSTKTVTLNPKDDLAYATKYYLYITDDVEDVDDVPVDDATYSFTTVVEPVRKGTSTRPLVRCNGQYIDFAATGAYPYVTTGRTMIPFRALFEAIGATVDYDASNPARQKITAKLGNNTVILYIGDKTAYKNGVKVILDVAPEILSSRTLIPLRFCGEALGAYVDYDSVNYIVIVEQNG